MQSPDTLFDPSGEAAAAPHSQSLYRKWRSQTFAELVGQDHVTRALKNAVTSGRIGHAYLFSGPRGTGKTSSARLLAKALNCLNADVAARPDGTCEACRAIAEGRAIDLIEIDAASNRGIDEIRDLRDKVNYAPAQARYKFYIIDEVHMLTEAAFNALLKTLEEPPPHAVFVLATTDPQDIPATVVSRCQQFQFRRLDLETIIDRLAYICEQEGLQCERGALDVIARSATGSMRDALSLLDQLIVTQNAGATLTTQEARQMLGLRGTEAVGRFVAAVLAADIAAGLDEIYGLVQSGTDIKRFNRDLVDQLRYIYLLKASPRAADLADIPDEQRQMLTAQAAQLDLPRLMVLLKIFSAVDYSMKVAPYAQLPLEIALLEAIIGTPEPPAADVAPPRALPQVKPAEAARPAPARTPDPAPVAPRRRGYVPPSETDAAPRVSITDITDETVVIVEASQEQEKVVIVVDTVVRAWPKVLESIRPLNQTIAALLRNAAPVALEDNLVTLAFDYEFHYNKIREEKNRAFVEQKLSEVVGTRLGVRCIQRPPAEAGGRADRIRDRYNQDN